MRSFIMLVFTLAALQTAEAALVRSPNGKTKVDVFPNMQFNCALGMEKIIYTTHDNQTDKKESSSCALTYTYVKNSKFIKQDKVLIATNKGRDVCSDSAKARVAKLQKKKFICTESGVN